MEIDPPPTDFDGPSVRALIGQLVDDTKAYARAEMRFVRAEVGDRAAHVGPAVGLVAGACVLLFAGLVAAIVGLTMWVGMMIGLGWAVLIMSTIIALIAYVMARLAARHFSLITRPWEKP